MHPLLLQQLEQHFGTSIDVPEEWAAFLAAVGEAYAQADREREPALRPGDAEDEFRTLAETMAAATFIYQGTRFRYINAAACDLTGYTREQLLEANFWDVVHPDHQEMIRERGLARQRGEAVSRRYQFKIVTREGEERWVDFTAGTILYQGEPAALGTAFDITDHKRTEEALRRQDLTFVTISDAVIISGVDGRIIDWNPGAAKMYGWSKDEILGKTGSLLHPAGEGEAITREILRTVLAAGKWTGELLYRRKDGSEGTSETSVVPLCDDNGQVVATIGVNRDITERRRAEEEMRCQALTFENLYDAVIITDLDGRITHWNPAAERIYGYSEEEVLGETVDLWLRPEERREINQEILGALGSHGRWSGEIRFVRKDGTSGVSETVVVPLHDQQGVRLGALGVNRDVTDRKAAEAALRASEERYRLMVEGSEQVFFYVHDPAGRFEYLSPSIQDVLGYRAEELLGRSYQVLLTGDPSDQLVEEQTQLTLHSGGGLTNYTAVTRHNDGRNVVLELVESPVVQEGAVVGVQGLARDITERRRAEEALKESEERYRTLFTESRDAIYMTSLDGRFVDVNQAALELFGYSEDEMLTMDAASIYAHVADRQRFQDEIARTGFVRDYEVRLLRRDGSSIDCLLSATLRRTTGGTIIGYQGIIHDITERKRAAEQLAYGALHDTLTGLPNRALFVDRLGQALDRSRRGDDPFAVLFLDLDRFKVINDSLGHGVGDELLVAIANRLEAVLHRGDTVARFGGDEFTLLLSNIPSAIEASHVAGRVMEALSQPFELNRHEVFTSASIGIALGSTGETDAEELLRNADAALSRAKVLGKGRYEVFDRAMHAQAMARLQLETDLRRAIERNEMRLVFQPIIKLDIGKICGFEALLRWEHPERGTISPIDFIPIAEETGLILPMGRWVIAEACQQLARWSVRLQGRGTLSMGVNLSAKQFSQPDLIEHVARTLEATGIIPERLKLEITETVILENAEPARSVLNGLRALGVELHMDDFGTGYSSLGYLHRFPLDALKIDRSFVAQMDGQQRSARLVQAIVALAHNLEVDTIAEGVATAEQLAALRALGCDYAQGYYISRPLRPDAAEALLREDPSW